jgi:hypothetical protein
MKKAILFISGLFLSTVGLAQTPVASPLIGRNVIKINLSSSIATEHYMLQYERALNLNRSIGLGVGISSGVNLPFQDFLLDQYGDDEDAKTAIETTKLDKLTITPEYRFYFNKKGAPIGFYLATFARYTKLSWTQDYTYTPNSEVPEHLHTAKVDGELNGIGAGAMLGIQWAIGKAITIDWWIVGPFVGTQSGDIHGVDPDMDHLSAQDKLDLEADIEDTEMPFWEIDATVGDEINATISGPFVGLRAMGICLGFRF